MRNFGLAKNKTARRSLAFFLSAVMALAVGIFVPKKTAMGGILDDPKLGPTNITTEFTSQKEAFDAGNNLNIELVSEGSVLLKNEGNILPIRTSAASPTKVSVFGKNSAAMALGGTGSSVGAGSATAKRSILFYDAMAQEHFDLNPRLMDFYNDNNQSWLGRQDPGMSTQNAISSGETRFSRYTADVKASYAPGTGYDKKAIMVITRIGGEGYDVPRTMMGGQGTEVEPENGTNRLGGTTDNTTPIYGAKEWNSHYLELDKHESDLLKEICSKISDVVIIFNTVQAFEASFLTDPTHEDYHPQIKGALWVGGLGSTGSVAVAKILSGEINPSGRLPDTWHSDFRKDPVMTNFGTPTGNQTNFIPNNGSKTGQYAVLSADGNSVSAGSTFVDYQEGVYQGYKYWETRGFTEGNSSWTAPSGYTFSRRTGTTYANWYDAHMSFPFGYGLSYTNFQWEFVENGSTTANNAVVASVDDDYELVYKVKVTNMGTEPGKDVVELYNSAPYYTGGIAKPHVKLAGFAKTGIIAPGASEIVEIRIRPRDMASYDWNDQNGNGFTGYELEAGNYNLYFSKSAHSWNDPAVLKRTVSVSVNTDVSAASPFDKAATEGKGKNGFAVTHDDKTGTKIENLFDDLSSKVNRADPTKGGRMTLMSRDDFAGTFPKAHPLIPTAAQIAADENWKDKLTNILINESAANLFLTGLPTTAAELNAWDEGKFNSVAKISETPVAWHKYAADEARPWYTTVMPTYAEKEAENPAILFKDLIGLDKTDAKWDAFMDQLTLAQLARVQADGGFRTANLDNLGVPTTLEFDGPMGMAPRIVGGPMNINNTEGTYNETGVNQGQIANYFPNAVIYCTAPVVAATWNYDLVRAYGAAVGEEGIWGNDNGYSYSGIYGPGNNIHRSPFSGRNFEYYSEDGYLAGAMTLAYCAGAAEKGVFAYMKHLLLNDQETNRGGILTFCDEQVLRENVAIAGEFAFKGEKMRDASGNIMKNTETGKIRYVKHTAALGIMAGFNNVGALPNNYNYAVWNDLFRNEFGFEGMVITDWTGTNFSTTNICPRMGVDKVLVGGSVGSVAIGGMGTSETDMANVTATQVTALRNASKNILYAVANSNGMVPKLKFTDFKTTMNANPSNANGWNMNGGNLSLAYGTVMLPNYTIGQPYKTTVNAAFTYKGAGNPLTIKYAVKEGSSLPAGLTLDEETGVISGTVNQRPPVGQTNFAFKIVATSPESIHTAEQLYRLPTPVVNPTTVNYLVSGATNLPYYDDSIRVVLSNGMNPVYFTTPATGNAALPAGLVMNNETGVITGTPVTAVANRAVTVYVWDKPSSVPEAERVLLLTLSYTVTINTGLAYNPTAEQRVLTGTLGEATNVTTACATGAATGGIITYTLTSGTMPEGLKFNSDGTITGIPTGTSHTVITVTASAPSRWSNSASFALIIKLPNNKWNTGAGAPAASLGFIEDLYLNLANGDIYEKMSDGWEMIGNMRGGDAVAPGILSGNAAPASSLGNNGDLYLNTVNGDVYQKAAGAWNVIANIKGATGDTGPTGPAGPKGCGSSSASIIALFSLLAGVFVVAIKKKF